MKTLTQNHSNRTDLPRQQPGAPKCNKIKVTIQQSRNSKTAKHQ